MFTFELYNRCKKIIKLKINYYMKITSEFFSILKIFRIKFTG